MKKVKVLESIHIQSLGITYNKGQEVEVKDEIAEKHIRSGRFELVEGKHKPTANPKSEKASGKTIAPIDAAAEVPSVES